MNSALKNRLVERIQKLLDDANLMLSSAEQHVLNHRKVKLVSGSLFHSWKVSSENIIEKASGNEGPYYKGFVDIVEERYTGHVIAGIGILKGLKDDLEQGFIKDPMDAARVEVFSDFLDMARHLLTKEHKDPAALLISAVLEGGLRKIAKKGGIKIKDKDDIGSLNTKIADAEIYGRLDQKQIQAWKDIRDSAVHANFDDYTDAQVKEMMTGVTRFLSENLKQ